MNNIYKYLIVAQQLKDGKFLIKFPDFKELLTVTEREENIEKVAKTFLKIRLLELKEEKLEFPTPKKLMDIQEDLGENEFILQITIDGLEKNIIDKDMLKENVENIRNKTGEILKGDFKENIEKLCKHSENIVKERVAKRLDKENYGMFGVVGGILYIISLFMPFIAVDVPFWGKLRVSIGNFSNLGELRGVVPIEKQLFLIKLLIILMFMNGIFVIYSAYKRNQLYIQASTLISVFLYILSYVIFLIKLFSLDSEARKYIGSSFAWVGLLIASVIIVIHFILDKERNSSGEGEGI
ncbi:hypothetical protein [Fusobacterium mortiferum]|uniref:hypothetical protein n=1 Tax=Fusobacterium mortiferum TaxID=850 RepID=UPI003F8F79B8